MITNTISPLELAWTIVALLGLGLQVALCHRTTVDLIIARRYNGRKKFREYAAFTSVLIFVGGLITQISYVTIGIVAMTQRSVHQHLTAANYINAGTIMTGSIIATIFAGIIYIRRVRIVEMLENQ